MSDNGKHGVACSREISAPYGRTGVIPCPDPDCSSHMEGCLGR